MRQRRKDPAKLEAEREYRRQPARRAAKLAGERKRLYGLDQQAFDGMFESQGRCCALCHTPHPCPHPRCHTEPDPASTGPGWCSVSKQQCWAVDHVHGTRRVRGILCQPCNAALGLLGDGPGPRIDAFVVNAQRYLAAGEELSDGPPVSPQGQPLLVGGLLQQGGRALPGVDEDD